MAKLLDELRYDARFIQSHKLQPAWYKILKFIILLGAFIAYWWLWGLIRAIIFMLTFFILSLCVHLVYRVGTHKFRESWLDFKIVEVEGNLQAKSIGFLYYVVILINALIAVLVSHWLG